MPTGHKHTFQELVDALQAYVSTRTNKDAAMSLNLTTGGLNIRLDKLEREYGEMVVRKRNQLRTRKLTSLGKKTIEKHARFMYLEIKDA
jgi:hypothetical protein